MPLLLAAAFPGFLPGIAAILAAAANAASGFRHTGLASGGATLCLVTAFIVGHLTIRSFMRYLDTHSVAISAWYRLALAATAAGIVGR